MLSNLKQVTEMPTQLGTVALPEAILLDVAGVAAMCDCSPKLVRRLSEAGKMPAPVRLGRLLRWRKAEILAWINAGCLPPRPVSAR